MDNMDHNQFSQLQDPYNAAGFGGRVNPQWSNEETRDFLLIRAELDPNFMETKRNKVLWDLVSTRMAEIGYNRTTVQCKCKWKNLVTRYKGCETMAEVEMRQSSFPFYNDMQIIFNARMERMLWQEVEGGGIGTAAAISQPLPPPENPPAAVGGMRELLEAYMRQHMEMETMWMKIYEEREEKREGTETAWRQRMEAAESEWLMMMRWWKERDEERKARDEARAERRDALVTALLNKLNDGGDL